MSQAKRQPTPPALLQTALQHHQAGRLSEAEALYKKMPNNPEAVNLLGVVAHQTGDNLKAAEIIGRAIRLNPKAPSFHYNLAVVYRALNDLDKAAASYRKAVALQPNYVDAHNNLGVILQAQGKLDEAVQCYRKVITLNPNYAEAYNNLGAVLREQQKHEEAIAFCHKALQLNPQHAAACNNLGTALKEQGKLDEAAAWFNKALALNPGYIEARSNLAGVLKDQGKLDEAIALYRAALALAPGHGDLHYNMGVAFREQEKLSEAAMHFRESIRLRPGFASAHNNLGIVLQSMGKLDDAIASFRRALELDAEARGAHSNLLYCHNYHPTLSAEEIFGEYKDWNDSHAAKLAVDVPPHANKRERERKLKVGYVSPDFRTHSSVNFSLPLIEGHDRSRFEVYCYYSHFRHDMFTERFIAAADHWVPCLSMSDEQLAERIRQDEIDILVDLAGHTSGHRLLTFARRPAPVQVSWMGYGYTTGLTAIDYFVGDAVFTPPGSESLFGEKIYRLPKVAWSYLPPKDTPEPGELPALRNGHVTFACLSRTERINARMIEAWAAILHRLPNARLRLDSRNFGDPLLCDDMAAQFAARGVPRSQLLMGFTSPVWSVFQDVDIVLDCFPHNSGTTTFEALWMGVPVVTLAERPSVGRLGASVLSCIGRPEWIATDTSDYIERAVALATDMNRLVEERSSLRRAMLQSPLMNHTAFVNDMEAAYRDMWHTWCENTSSDT